jgi:pimeloyl-ACP methyl ester carboxylesterase
MALIQQSEPQRKEADMMSQETMVDIGNGIRLWLQSMGQGSPTILLEGPGPACDSEPWMAIQTRLAQETRSCRYDRAGTGKSSGTELPVPSIPPRTQDLEKLLEAASLEPPYLMVGYSLGGAIVLRYARQHLDRMAGLVLIESATESILPRFENQTTNVNSGRDQNSSLGDLPLIVMTIDTQEYILPRLPNTTPEEAMKTWLEAQSGLAALSTRGRQVLLKNANHYGILESHARDIIRAITIVVNESRQDNLLK